MKLKREVILEIRDLARHLRDAFADMPQSLDPARDEGISQRTKEYFSDPIRIQLETMIGDLPKHERAELVALVDLGTLGKGVKDWVSLLHNAKQTDGEETARNLVGRSPFAYLIDQGLAKIQATKYYEDELALAPIESRTKPFRLMLRMMKAILPKLSGEYPVLEISWNPF
jgi:hypothetical protein